MANEIIQSQQNAVTPIKRFNQLIANTKTQDYLQSVLGAKKSSFVANVTALVTNNVQLQECEPMSVIYSAIKATALDLPLDPSLGCAYVIPFRNNRLGKTDAQFQLGYRGYIQLAIRSGQFRSINVAEIREGEIKGYDLLSGEIQLEGKENRESLPIVGYIAYFKLLNGFEKSLYMTLAEVEAHAQRYSQTYKADKKNGYKSSKWSDDFDAMAKKTVLKLLLARYAPKSVEMQMVNQAVRDDSVVVDSNNVEQYLDNPETVEKVSVDDQSQEALSRAQEAMDKVEAMKARQRARTVAERSANEPVVDMPQDVFNGAENV